LVYLLLYHYPISKIKKTNMKLGKTLKKLLGPSPMFYTIEKVKLLKLRCGADSSRGNHRYMPENEFSEMIWQEGVGDKPRRLTGREIQKMLAEKRQILTSNQKLLQSVLKEAKATGDVKPDGLINLLQQYGLRRDYRWYLRVKRLIPLGLIAPFTNGELTKMTYATTLGSKSVSLTLIGLIGYSLPSFFFFHMTEYYVPSKLKPFCQVGKYVLGAPVWVANSLVDHGLEPLEDKFFGEPVPIDITNTGGTIPSDLGDLNKLKDLMNEIKNLHPLGLLPSDLKVSELDEFIESVRAFENH